MKDNLKNLYPSFLWVKERGQIFPNLRLPLNYKTKIKLFYESGGKERIEGFARNLSKSMEGIFGRDDIKLKWDDKKGLINISIGPSGGLDLNNYDIFQEHNLGSRTSLMAGAIVINYIYELI